MKIKIVLANPEYEYKITAEVISWFGFRRTIYTLEGLEWKNTKTSVFVKAGSKIETVIDTAFTDMLKDAFAENRSKENGKRDFPVSTLSPDDINVSIANGRRYDNRKVKLDAFSEAFCPMIESQFDDIGYKVRIVKNEKNHMQVWPVNLVAPILSKDTEPVDIVVSTNAANKVVETLVEFAYTIFNWYKDNNFAEFGPTALLINPVFHHTLLPVSLIQDNRVNVDMFDEIFVKIEEVISKVRNNPQYLAECAEHGLKSKIVVGADPILAHMLAIRGIDAVSTHNLRLRNKIIVVPTIEEIDETKGKPHYLRFGNFVAREVTVTEYAGENPNLVGYKVYQPAYRVVLNVPIMGLIEFS